MIHAEIELSSPKYKDASLYFEEACEIEALLFN